MTFAEQLKEARKSAGLTQQQLADMTLIPKRTIESWESVGKAGRDAPEWCQRLVLNEIERLKRTADEEGIYLIFKDSMDDCCEIVGYIKGTEEEADKYCDEYNKKQAKYWRKVEYEKIHDLCNEGK